MVSVCLDEFRRKRFPTYHAVKNLCTWNDAGKNFFVI